MRVLNLTRMGVARTSICYILTRMQELRQL